MAELHEQGLIFIIPTAGAIHIPGIHFSQTHWALKKGKEHGRPVGDASAREGDGFALNSDEVAEKVKEKWGEIKHPTVKALADMVLRVTERHGWDEVVLWKMDLKGAFTLLFVDPDSCQRLAFQLTDGLTMLYHVGMFGWTGMPAAFQVVTRVITRALAGRLRPGGEALMYVDDLMGCCRLADLEHDLDQARQLCNGLLGPGAVAEKKTSYGRRQDFIGWEFDLDRRRVSVARHNYLKALYGFLELNVHTPTVQVRDLQRVASWASRYSAVCRTLKPFTQDLFACIRGRNPHAWVNWSDPARRAVEIWRAVLLALQVYPDDLARPLHTVGSRSARYLIEYDASLTGIGVVISTIGSGLDTKQLFCVSAVSLKDFGLEQESGNQNTCEFIAVVTGLAILAARGVSGAGVKLIGDNTSSLSWCCRERFHSSIGKATSMVFMTIVTFCDLQIVEGVHIPGERNVVPDRLSRDVPYQDLGFADRDFFRVEPQSAVGDAVRACDPGRDVSGSDQAFYAFWGHCSDVTHRLLTTPGV